MESLSAYWSESKQKDLEAQLVGFGAKDIWDRTECPLAKGIDWRGKNGVIQGKKEIHFNCLSKSINTELKYALWQKIEQQEWSPMTIWRHTHIHVGWIIKWINAYVPNTNSFMERNLEKWEFSFRSYLAGQGKLIIKQRQYLAEGEIRFSQKDDPKMSTLRGIYRTLQQIYDGVPIHIVQKYLGHTSLEMTLRYTHIHDQTLKEEFAKYQGKMVDIAGKVIQPENVMAEIAQGSNLNRIDEQWMKYNILAQALPNGLCSLPVIQGACPYGANKCLSCTHFKTDIRYLDKHQEHLKRTREIVEWAQQNPDSRRSQEILKENLPVKENLEKIISTLEVNYDA